VLPGNRKFVEGDTISRRSEGGGGSSRDGGEGEGADAFRFALTRQEFLDLCMDDLEFPDMACGGRVMRCPARSRILPWPAQCVSPSRGAAPPGITYSCADARDAAAQYTLANVLNADGVAGLSIMQRSPSGCVGPPTKGTPPLNTGLVGPIVTDALRRLDALVARIPRDGISVTG